jgi:hypothetical protein
MDVAFYTVANSPFFLGLTGLVNSLRLTGHSQPIIVLDAGLTESQRTALAGQCEFVPAPPVAVTNPALWKAAGPHTHPADLIVLIDSDIVVTGSLEPILESARQGQVCAYPDPDSGRWFEEWDTTFDLPPMRRQTYVNTGFVAISTRAWPGFVDRWWGLCQRIRTHPTLYEGARNGPTSQADQDAFNALMMSEFPAGALVPLDPMEGPITQDAIRDEVEVLEERSFTCVRQGIPVRLLHWAYKPKCWAPEARSRSQYHAYARLLVRATTWPDAPVRLPRSAIPYWMRPDPVSRTRAFLRRVAGLTYRSLERRFTPASGS